MKTTIHFLVATLIAICILVTSCKKQTDYSSQINALQARCDSLAAALKATNAALQATNNNVSSLSTSVTTIQAQLTVIAGQIATLNTQLTATNSNVSSIESQLAVIVGQIATLNTQLTATNSNVTIILNQLVTVVSQIATLNTQLNATNVNVTVINNQIIASNTQLNIMLIQLNTLLAQVPTVTDIDGNLYKTVIIGKQVWMADNLKTTHYRNGDPIPNITNTTTWANQVNGAYCDFTNNVTFGATYGHLYNFYTVVDSRQLCPVGWHVPSESEWTTLINYLGGMNMAGKKLREAGTNHWLITGGDNSSGFTALGGSWRGGDGNFYYWVGQSAWWWTSTEQVALNPITIGLGADDMVYKNWDTYHTKAAGNSIRCIKD